MKRIITTALMLAMASTLSGCGSKEDSKSSTKSPEEAFFEEVIDEYEDDEKEKKITLTDYVTVKFEGWNGEFDNTVEFIIDYKKLADDINIDTITPEFLSKCYHAASRTQYFSTNGNKFEYAVEDISEYEDLSEYTEELKKLRELEIKTGKTETITVEGLRDKVYLTKVSKSTDMSLVDDILDAEAKGKVGNGLSGIHTNNPLGEESSVNYQELFKIQGNIYNCRLQVSDCEKVGSYFAQKNTTNTQYNDDKEFTPNLYINVYKYKIVNLIDNSEYECYFSVAKGYILDDNGKGTVVKSDNKIYKNSALDLNEVINFGEIYKAIEVK